LVQTGGAFVSIGGGGVTGGALVSIGGGGGLLVGATCANIWLPRTSAAVIVARAMSFFMMILFG